MATSDKFNGNSVETNWARAPPAQGNFCERFAKAIYNPEEKSILGRTPKRWGIMLTFYAIFYAVLAAMFAVCMLGLYKSIDKSRPTYLLKQSLIGDNPGVAYRPIPGGDGFLLDYDVTESNTSLAYIQDLETFFKTYDSDSWYSSKAECGPADNFGFPDTPCVFIKVNKIFGWQPVFYEASGLPADMTEDLAEYIKGLKEDEQKQVWVSCWDEKNSSSTTFEYPWGRGLPAALYPYSGDEAYRSPLVAVKVTPTANILTVIRCRAWAKNIVYNKSMKEPSGYTRIQILVKDNVFNTTQTDA